MKHPFKTIMGTSLLVANLAIVAIFLSLRVNNDLMAFLEEDRTLVTVIVGVYGSSLVTGLLLYLAHRQSSRQD